MSVTGQGGHSDAFLLARSPWEKHETEEPAPVSETAPTTLRRAPASLSSSREPERFGDALAASPVMRQLFETLARVAPLDLSVLLEGESGTGKDVLARAIHAASSRAKGPFMVVDCGAIPPNLIESELFGHERGAFTGADVARRGVFEEANGGTLFLDEIGELPLDMQPKLLRALEQREVRPVGGRVARPIDVRVVAATHKKLAALSQTGGFRSDLFYRLAVVRATVPPLRERPDDVLPIARTMLRAILHDAAADFPEAVAMRLLACPWPGNVRELRNVVERFAAFGADGLFESSDSPPPESNEDLASLTYHEAKRRVLTASRRPTSRASSSAPVGS